METVFVNNKMPEQTSKKLLKIGAIAIGAILLCCGLLLILTFMPPIQATSPDGRFICYVKTSIIPSNLYDSELQITNTKSGQTVTAAKIYGGVFEEKPINLTWDDNSRRFVYVFSAEVIGNTYKGFDVIESPFEVKSSVGKEEDEWIINLLKRQIAKGDEKDVAEDLLHKIKSWK